jgi:flagellar basal-body rod protein FlgB
VWIENILNSGSAPVLEKVAAFTEARQEVLANNISNFDTVGYREKDLSVSEFQKAMDAALARRENGGAGAALELEPTKNLQWDADGKLTATPVPSQKTDILFHDQNNRSVEKQMSEMMKNALLHNVTNEMLRLEYNGLSTAIRGRL